MQKLSLTVAVTLPQQPQLTLPEDQAVLLFQSVQLSLLTINLSLLRLDLLLHSRILVLPLLHLIPDHGAAKEAYRGTDARARSRIARRAADNGA